jgi:hypothetical protein
VRDWKFIKECTSHIEDDPFTLVATKKPSLKLIEDADMINDDNLERPKAEHLWVMLPSYPRHSKISKDKYAEINRRFWWGFGGGLALVGPMLIMRLHHDGVVRHGFCFECSSNLRRVNTIPGSS